MSKKLMKIVISELDNASIRHNLDGWYSVFDLIRIVGGQKNPHETWKRLRKEYPEVLTKCENFKFPGRGQRKTPVTDREGWAYIIGLLPGVMGRRYRESAAKLVTRYLDGDIKLADEIADRNDNQADLEWLEARVRGKVNRKRLTGIYRSHGVVRRGYGVCTNKLYIGLYGTTAQGMRKRKGLPDKANWRDHASISELNEISFSEDLSGQRIVKVNAKGNNQCADVTHDVAKKVAEFTKEILSA